MTTRQLLRGKYAPWVILVVITVTVLGQRFGWQDQFQSLNNLLQNDPGYYTVVDYSDGDTLVVDMNGTPETIRFIGVDTPETHKPKTPVQCGGPEASAYTKARVLPHGKVRLQSDPLSSNRDRYNRLLRYVYLPDGSLLNQELIKNGYGFAYTYFSFTRSAQFTMDESIARQASKGLWAYCKPTPNEFGGYTSNPRGT